jgi:uncharacterized protein
MHRRIQPVSVPNEQSTDPSRPPLALAAIEHYTAVLGDVALNCRWADYGADPMVMDLFRWHGSEEVEHRNVTHDVAVYFHNSYPDRIRSMLTAATMVFVFFQRGT